MNTIRYHIVFLSFFMIIPTYLSAIVDTSNNLEAAFTHTYNSRIWGADSEGYGTSGSGSVPKDAKPYMDFLQFFLTEHDIKTVVDVGCGDWSFSQYIDWTGISYKGYDLVEKVIENNKQKFNRPGCEFIQGDATKLDLPSADLLICKDVLMHLSYKNIQLFLQQCKKFKYCLITNNSNVNNNYDIVDGDFRCLDLTKAPLFVPGVKIFRYNGPQPKEILLIARSKINY